MGQLSAPGPVEKAHEAIGLVMAGLLTVALLTAIAQRGV